MARYYFHVASKEDWVVDTDGRELPDLASAHRHAVKLIQQMLLYLPDEHMNGWRLEICNALGVPEMSVLFPWHFAFWASHKCSTGR